MNIYIVPAWYPISECDITASFIREQAHALKKRGHRIIVLFIKRFSICETKKWMRYHPHCWDDDGIITKYYKILSLIPSRFEAFQHRCISHKYYKILKQSIRSDEYLFGFIPDVVHAHVGPWCAYYVINGAKKLNIPIITTEHYSGLAFGTKSDIKYIREKFVINNSNLTIFVGTNLQREVLKKTEAKGATVVIPNSINNTLFENKKYDYTNIFTFLTACHLIPLKNVDIVIKAFHEEFSEDENVSYVIAGDGELRNELEALVNNLGEGNRIKFYGKYDRKEMPNLFSSCNAFVLVSKYETFGIVYVEALMCGLPCIGTRGQGSDDIIESTNGIQVEPNNIEQLKDAMRFLYNNIQKYNPYLIKENAIRKFSDDHVCSEIEKYYYKLVSKIQ